MISSEDSSDSTFFFNAATGFLATGLTGFSLLSSEDSLACFLVATTGLVTFFGLTSYSSSELGSLAFTGFLVLGFSTDAFLGAGASSSTEALDPFLGALTTFFLDWAGVSSSLSSLGGACF